MRGYSATTIRDIASAAGMGIGNVYRFIRSKEELLASIMDFFQAQTSEAYDQIVQSQSTPTEKLDALTWLNINLLGAYDEEFRIQLSWLAISPDVSNLGEFPSRREVQVSALVKEGLDAGEFRSSYGQDETPPTDLLALCIRDLIWPPLNIIERESSFAALKYARATTLRGAATRRRDALPRLSEKNDGR